MVTSFPVSSARAPELTWYFPDLPSSIPDSGSPISAGISSGPAGIQGPAPGIGISPKAIQVRV